MVTPTTWLSAVLLLVLSFVCLGSWANTFKQAGKWRFELYSFDFAIGALLCSVIAAYTLGTLGSDLGFSDRILVSGRTNQVLAIAAGGVFMLGNMLLLSTVSLIGMAAAFPLVFGTAIAIAALVQSSGSNLPLLSGGVTLLILTVLLEAIAARQGESVLPGSAPLPTKKAGGPKSKSSRQYMQERERAPMQASIKGTIVGVISGVALGFFFPLIYRITTGDFGLGPYAGVLLCSIGIIGATMVLNFYFTNIAIHGGSIGFNSYLRGTPSQHFLGILGGAVWAVGALALGLAINVPKDINPGKFMECALASGSVVLAVFWGLARWREFSAAPPKASISVLVSAAAFAGGIALISLSWSPS